MTGKATSLSHPEGAASAATPARAHDGDARTDALAYREFLRNVVCGPYLLAMTDERQREYFLEQLTRAAAGDDPAFEPNARTGASGTSARLCGACMSGPSWNSD